MSGEGHSERRRLSRGALLVRNTVLNIGGQTITTLAGLAAIPVLLHGLGLARFGVLTLVWAVFGYAGFFDLGLGRALTAVTSSRLGAGRRDDLPALLSTAVVFLLAVGVVVGIAFALASTWLVTNVLNVPGDLQQEGLVSFLLLAAAIPFVVGSTGLRGYLEAHQRFDLTNAVLVGVSAVTYLGPAIVVQFSSSLVPVVAVIAFSRPLAFTINLILCARVTPGFNRSTRPTRAMMGPLARFGGWVSVANILGPLMGTLDRFIIGAVLTTAAVAHYATPFDAVTRMLILTGAVTSVLFPAFALNLSADPERTAKLFSSGARFVLVTLFVPMLIAATLAQWLIRLWLGADFAQASYVVLQILTVGVFLNGLAQVAYSLVQSGRPDLPAKVVLIELPLYLGTFYLLLKTFGIVGAAAASTLHVVADTSVYGIFVARLVKPARRFVVRLGVALALLSLAFPLGAAIPGLAAKFAYLVVVVTAFLVVGWRRLLLPDEREHVARQARKLVGKVRGEGPAPEPRSSEEPLPAPIPAPRTSEPLVHVGIPTCERPDFVVETVRSVLGQDYRNLRVFVSENGPGGGPVERALAPLLSDERVTFSATGENLGAPANWTRVLQAAGDAAYVAILNDDDRWHPGWLDRRVAFLEREPACGFVYSGEMRIDDDGETIGRSITRLDEGIYQPADFVRLRFTREQSMHTAAALMRRSALAEVGDAVDGRWRFFDTELFYRLGVRSPVGFLATRDCDLRFHTREGQSLTFTTSTMSGAEWLAYHAHVEALAQRSIPGFSMPRAFHRQVGRAHLIAGVDAFERGERPEALAHLRQGVRSDLALALDKRALALGGGLLLGPRGPAVIGRLRTRARRPEGAAGWAAEPLDSGRSR